jgi:hypothetical protein
MTGKCFILGTFSNISAQAFPVVLSELHVYIAMTNGHGSGRGKLQLVPNSKDEPLLELEGNIQFPNPLAVVEMDFRIEHLPFPAPGEYEFRLLYNDMQIGLRKIVVQPGGTIPREKA